MARIADPEMRTRILDAADRLLARHGFRRMSIDEIAREAKIGKGSVYLHFPSKEDVALSCIDRMAAGVVNELRTLAGAARPARRRLTDMLRARVLLRFEYARHHAPSIDEKLAVMRQAMLERRTTHFAEEAGVIARVIAEGRASGEFAGPPPLRAARAMVTATNALLPYSLSVTELGQRSSLLRRTSEVVELLLSGLSPGHDSTRSRRNA